MSALPPCLEGQDRHVTCAAMPKPDGSRLPDLGLCVQGVSLLKSPSRQSPSPAPRQERPHSRDRFSKSEPKVKDVQGIASKAPAQPTDFCCKGSQGPWIQVWRAGFADTIYVSEDTEETVTEVFVPDFWDDEWDRTDQVKWRRRALRCTPALGHCAGTEVIFVYDEHPEKVMCDGSELRCERCGPDASGRELFVQLCLDAAMTKFVSRRDKLSREALSRATLLPGADQIRALAPPLSHAVKAVSKIESFLCGEALVQVCRLGFQSTNLRFRLPLAASFAELYHATAAAFFQAGVMFEAGFVLSTPDGSTLLPCRQDIKLDQPSLRCQPDSSNYRSRVDEHSDDNGGQTKIFVHDITGALIAAMALYASATSALCKHRIRKVTGRHEPDDCMSLVLENGVEWHAETVGSLDTPVVQLTLVWGSAFQFVVVPWNSSAQVIAGRGVFSPEQIPPRDGVSRIGFALQGSRPLAGAHKLKQLCNSTGGPRAVADEGHDAMPDFDEDDVAIAQGVTHIFEIGPVQKMTVNMTSDGNQVGGSFYQAWLPVSASSAVLRSYLARMFDRHSQGRNQDWYRLTQLGDKFNAIAFTDLRLLVENGQLEGFTVSSN